MKKFIAFYANSSSGIQTRDNALGWASDAMTNNKVNKVYLAEVVEVVERQIPPITVKSFLVAAEDEAKVAA